MIEKEIRNRRKLRESTVNTRKQTINKPTLIVDSVKKTKYGVD